MEIAAELNEKPSLNACFSINQGGLGESVFLTLRASRFHHVDFTADNSTDISTSYRPQSTQA